MSHGGSSLLQVHVFSHGGTLREIKMKQFEVLRLKKLPLVNWGGIEKIFSLKFKKKLEEKLVFVTFYSHFSVDIFPGLKSILQ